MENRKETIKKIKVGFDKRVKNAIDDYLQKGLTYEPKLEPLENGRPIYTRDYSYSVLYGALCVFFNNVENEFENVNRELKENCQMYLASKHLRNDCDSFYWGACLLCQIIELFGKDGKKTPGLVKESVEQIMYKMMWEWLYDNSRIEDADYNNTKTWHVWNSENHHIQKFSAIWHFLKLLLKQQDYQELKLEDGYSIETHFEVWNEYSKEWIRERGRRGLFVESGAGNYTNDTLKGIYNYFEYGEDQELKKLSSELLDLYWASWAVEQLNGVRGGGKSRAYPNLHLTGMDHMRRVAWYYLGIGEACSIKGNDLVYMLNSYRIPNMIMELALDSDARGDYEVKNRVMGLAEDGYYKPLNYRLADEGGVLRYAYCTPEFIMGSLMTEARPASDWTMISSQNRWQGIIFPEDVNARIHIQCVAEREPYGANRLQSMGGIMRSYNQHWTLQSKGTMITQKLKTSLAAKEMQVWIAESCQQKLLEQGNWIFMEMKGAYCGVHVAQGDYYWKKNKDGIPGKWLVLKNEWSPVIVEVAKKSNFKNREEFINRCCTNYLKMKNGILHYNSIYNEKLTFYYDYSKLYEVNGVPVDLYNEYAFQCPYILAKWKSGEVKISFREEVLRQNY